MLSTFICIGLLGSPLGAQEGLFSPLSLRDAIYRSDQKPVVQVRPGSGQVSFSMKIGKGLAVRNLSFAPRIEVSPTARTKSSYGGAMAFNNGSGGWDPGSGGYQSGSVANIPSSSLNAIFYRPGLVQTTCPSGDYLVQNVNQDTSGIFGFNPGNGRVGVSGSGNVQFKLPSGESVFSHKFGIDGLGSTGHSIEMATKSEILSNFGYSLQEISSLGVERGSSDSVFIPLMRPDGSEAVYTDGTGTKKYPSRVLIIKSELAYEFEAYRANWLSHFETGEPQDYNNWEELVSFEYRPKSIVNRYGDKILFSYDPDWIGYTAELFILGQPTQEKVRIQAGPKSIGMSFPNPWSPGGTNYDYADVNLTILVSRQSQGEEVDRYEIKGFMDRNHLQQAPITQLYSLYGLRSPGESFAPTEIKHPASGAVTTLSYRWLAASHPAVPALSVRAVAFDKIRINQLEHQFSYTPSEISTSPGYEQTIQWNDVIWGVSSHKLVDLSNMQSRENKFVRKFSRLRSYNATGTPREYVEREYWEACTFPDGSTQVTKFVPPISVEKQWELESNFNNRLQMLLFWEGVPFEIRKYTPGASWVGDITTYDNPLAYSIGTFSAFDIRNFCDPVGEKSINRDGWGDPTARQGMIGSLPYSTKYVVWDRRKDTLTISRKEDWSSSSFAWGTEAEYRLGNAAARVLARDGFKPPMEELTSPTLLQGPLPSIRLASADSVRGNQFQFLDPSDKFLFGMPTRVDFLPSGALPARVVDYHSKGFPIRDRKIGASGRFLGKKFEHEKDGIPSLVTYEASADFANSVLLASLQLGYDQMLRPASAEYLNTGLRSSQAWNNMGQISQVTDVNDLRYEYEWDSLGRIRTAQPPNGEVAFAVNYSPDFLRYDTVRGEERREQAFNGFGDLVWEARTDSSNPAASGKRYFGYDSTGRKRWETGWLSSSGTAPKWWDPNPGVPCTMISYNEYGEVTSASDPNGQVTYTDYSGLTKIVRIPKSNGTEIRTRFTLDVSGRLQQVEDALGQVTQYDYDEADRISQVVQWGGAIGSNTSQTRSWVYDDLGFLRVLDQPESGSTYFASFNPLGKPSEVVYGLPRGWRPANVNLRDGSAFQSNSARGVNTRYDELGRVVRVYSNDGTVDNWLTYGDQESGHGLSRGKLVRTLSGAAVARSLIYGGLNGRLSGITRSMGGIEWTQGLEYGLDGNLLSRIYPDGNVQLFSYDPAKGLPVGTNFRGSNVATFSYPSPHWGLEGISWAGGPSSFYVYDNDQVRLKSMVHMLNTDQLKSWNFQYDEVGNLVSDGEDFYSYDLLGRLKEVLVRDIDPSSGTTVGSNRALQQKLEYDAFGNRKKLETLSVTNWAWGLPRPQTTVTDSVFGDARSFGNYLMSEAEVGNMSATNRLPASLGGVNTGAIYDAMGNLTQIWKTPGDMNSQLTLIYDALGRVIQLGDSTRGIVEKYSYDDEGLRAVVEVYESGRLQKKTFNVYNEARQLIAQYEMVLE